MTHRPLGWRPLGALVLSSGLSLALLFGCNAFIHHWPHYGLMWNLLLAWIPLVCALAVQALSEARTPWRYPALAVCAGFWLLFFPNAPYLITDLIHIPAHSALPAWYAAILILAFVWTGLLIGLTSLSLMQNLVSQRLGRAAGWLFTFGTLGLGSLGVFLGRFLRLNSWDVFTRPVIVLGDVWASLRHPLGEPLAYVASLIWTAFFASAYFALLSFARPSSEATEGQP